MMVLQYLYLTLSLSKGSLIPCSLSLCLSLSAQVYLFTGKPLFCRTLCVPKGLKNFALILPWCVNVAVIRDVVIPWCALCVCVCAYSISRLVNLIGGDYVYPGVNEVTDSQLLTQGSHPLGTGLQHFDWCSRLEHI